MIASPVLEIRGYSSKNGASSLRVQKETSHHDDNDGKELQETSCAIMKLMLIKISKKSENKHDVA